MKIKICGLTREEDIRIVNDVRPDYVGFVFAGNKRKVDEAQAARLRQLLDENIPAVGVFVDVPIEQIYRLVKAKTVQLVQLHGNEDEDYITALNESCNVPVIKAFSVQTKADIEKARESSVSWVLLDNGKGGTGERFPWELIPALQHTFFLAGGLSPENVREAATYRPYALDVSSGVETNGKKDKEKIKRFVTYVRNL
ncbi:MAG: phosphoribosylanthranilate isomerase [Megasphaera micronuciformis]|nr:phosphoribosylanthranilate isomerase [Megasphaera micronuciformis]